MYNEREAIIAHPLAFISAAQYLFCRKRAITIVPYSIHFFLVYSLKLISAMKLKKKKLKKKYNKIYLQSY
jgi:hypothetical protein